MQLKTQPVGEVTTRSEPLKILYVQPGTSSFAGIERVIDTICSSLMEKYATDFDVDVLYTSVHKNRMKEVERYTAIDQVAASRIDLMRILRRVIGGKKYDLVVVPQIEPTVICMASCIGIRRRFVMHLHGNPRLESTHLKARILFLLMRALFLPRVAFVFGTSPKQLEAFKRMFNSQKPHYWVPNPVRDFQIIHCEQPRQSDCVTFVNVGRFSFQKGQDILLEAFGQVFKTRQNVKLKIVGHGEEETLLRQKIEHLGLKDVVSLEHYPENPQPALVESDVYVSSSRWEGWSLAICEALRFGLPVIATDCEFGPSDILTDSRLGRLVPIDSQDDLANAMNYYADNLALEQQHAGFRRQYVDRFSAHVVVDAHAQALRTAASA